MLPHNSGKDVNVPRYLYDAVFHSLSYVAW